MIHHLKNTMKNHLVLHHLGCATENIEASKKVYAETLGFSNISETILISRQNVKVCFIETAPGVFIELVEATGENAFLKKILKSNNPFYHTGYLTNDIDSTIEKLLQQHCHLVNRFESEAFGNRECAFLYTPEMHLIELIQTDLSE